MKQYLCQKFDSSLFNTKQIFSMLTPLIMDSFFVCAIGVLTTAMISSSSQESVSAVSLVSPLYLMVYAIYNAVSAGGTVVVAQFKGKGDAEGMKKAAGQLMVVTPLSAVIACAILVIFADPLVHMLFGGVDETVLEKAEQYLIGIAISMIFLAVYMSGFAVFRGLGETKCCLHLTILINLLHFVASFVFINMMHLDIMGSVLSLNLARFVGAAASMWMLLSPKSILQVKRRHVFPLDKKILREIFRIGIPYGTEQLFMNGGSMLVQIYIAKLGTVSVAANAVANSTFSLLYAAPAVVGTLAVTVVGQCIGAGDASYSSYFSLVTMWVIRVAFGYLLAIPLKLGIQGVWIGMCVEWAVKTLAFAHRFRGDKWLTHKQCL